MIFNYITLHIFQGAGDAGMAYQCFRLALSANHDNAEACCNLAVLEMRKGNSDQVNLKFFLYSALTKMCYLFRRKFYFKLR